jgi:hypothetical protein
MELRKDPITRSWVITGDDPGDATPNLQVRCRFCETAPQVIAKTPHPSMLDFFITTALVMSSN